MGTSSLFTRNLSKIDLGGVIFGCTHDTMKECLVNQLFGLPGQHIGYVQNIECGLPLFLFNYSDRKLHGVFEAECRGQLNIDPYAWSRNRTERTKYPAQVRICTRMSCEPLMEKQFKPIIVNNYYSRSHFCFELDRTQASALISLFSPSQVICGTTKWVPKVALNPDATLQVEHLKPSVSEADLSCLAQSYVKPVVSSDTPCASEQNCLSEIDTNREDEKNEEELVYLKLKKLAIECDNTNSSIMDHAAGALSNINVEKLENDIALETLSDATDKSAQTSTRDLSKVMHQAICENEETSTSDVQLVMLQLAQGKQEFRTFTEEQLRKTSLMEKKMAESELEIQRLKDRVQLLERRLGSSNAYAGEPLPKPFDETPVNGDEMIFLLGGYNGYSFLSTLDCYSPSHDTLRSLQSMSTIRSHAAAAVLNGHIYIFGGGNGNMWYNTVEAYNPSSDKWTSCPSFNVGKGNLSGASLQGKLYAIGGGNEDQCLSDVEMFDPSHGRWIRIPALQQKRFAPASVALSGALYAVGGYDGAAYLQSAERFDPRESSWKYLPCLNTRRGCHSLVAFKEKLYAIGGYDGERTVSSVEVLDLRFGSWRMSNPMNLSRGYAGAVVIGESIYVAGGVQGGVQNGRNFVDTVEFYKEERGWFTTKSRAIGKRCFFSTVVL